MELLILSMVIRADREVGRCMRGMSRASYEHSAARKKGLNPIHRVHQSNAIQIHNLY